MEANLFAYKIPEVLRLPLGLALSRHLTEDVLSVVTQAVVSSSQTKDIIACLHLLLHLHREVIGTVLMQSAPTRIELETSIASALEEKYLITLY